MTTDKTSTAPVMSLQKVRDALHEAHNSPGFEAVLDSCVAAIDAQPKGDADQCQVRKDNQGLDESGRLAPLSPEQTRGDGVAAMPASFLISKKALEGIHYMCGGDEDGAEIDDRWCEGMAWIGHLDNGDGTSSYGLHLHNADYPEEGSITIAQFVERDAPRQAVPEFTRTKPLVPGYYLVRGYTWPYEGEAYDKQAAVEVRQRDDGLVVNLHEKNSDEDMDRWYLVETIDSNFEWAMLAAAPLAGRMGVDRG